MERILEPEVMDDEEQAIAYARADFSSSNQAFVDGLLEEYSSRLRVVLDIGCGPADVPIRLARAKPSIHIIAVDASDAMVRLAGKAVRAAGLDEQIRVMRGRVPGLPFGEADFDTILSKDLLHHLADPMVFWEELKRLAGYGTAVYIMDLFRPETKEDARSIVEFVSGAEPEILKRDFYSSLLAALTPAEVEDQLRRAGLALAVDVVSHRHLRVRGLLK
jgi:ubiquinone/menaquinone biosynthesis C-methylase UbiE